MHNPPTKAGWNMEIHQVKAVFSSNLINNAYLQEERKCLESC